MKIFGVFLTLFGIIVVIYPEFLAYLIGGFFIFLGINIFLIGGGFSFTKGFGFKKSGTGDSHVKFGKYKIYR